MPQSGKPKRSSPSRTTATPTRVKNATKAPDKTLQGGPQAPMEQSRPSARGRSNLRKATVPTPMPAVSAAPTDPPQRCQLCAARLTCLVGQLPRPLQERLDSQIREVDFRKGETLQTEGIDPVVVRTIKLGTVMLTRAGPDRVSRPVAMVGRGHLLGMWGLLAKTTQVGAQALSSGRVCELPVVALRNTLGKDVSLLGSLHDQMALTFARLADWSQVMRLRGLPRQLVATLMLLTHEQGTRAAHLPSHIALAALLSTTRESVARTLRQLEDRGHLRRNDRWHGELTDSHLEVFQDDAP